MNCGDIGALLFLLTLLLLAKIQVDIWDHEIPDEDYPEPDDE